MLLHVGADVNVQSFRKETPLANAIRAGNTELVEILLSKGAEVWTIDNEWMNPLQRAFQCLDLAGIKKLVEAGADPRKSLAQPQLDRRRPSYLQIAAILDRADCIEYLVRDIGIPVNDKNRGGVALHDAIRHANLASFRKLLELGALANAGQDLDTYAITLQCAIDAGLFSMLQEVMAVDVDINAIGKIPIQDSTVLHLAVESGWYAAVKLMLDAGADVSLKRPDGLSLLQLGAKLLVENQSPIENTEGRQHVFSCLLTRAYPEAFRRR
jgi:ankyrin repeat protein